MSLFSYARPRALAEALKLLKNGTIALAGGTDLVTLVRHGVARPDRLVDLTGIAGLRGIAREKGRGIRIGALTPLSVVEHSAELAKLMPIVPQSLRDAATPQIRNMGTVGGNLLQRNRCWYFRDEGVPCWLKGGKRCFAVDGENRYHAVVGAHECWMVSPSDLAPALIACDAEIEISSSLGKRRMKLAELFIAPHGRERREHSIRAGELITAVRIPEKALDRRGTYLKAMERKAWSFAIVSVAASARVKDGKATDVRLVLGGVAPVPWRVPAAEKLLEGTALDDNACLLAADALLDGAQPLRDNGYKVTLARELVRRALRSLVTA